MIAALALWSAQTFNPVREWIDPKAGVISIQAVVQLPPLDPRERAAAVVLSQVMEDEVEGYSRADMRELASRAGERLRIWLMPDHLRIQYGVLPADLKPALGYVNQLLRMSKLPAEALANAVAEAPFRKRTQWETAVQPEKLDFSRMRRQEVIDVYHRICRPENVWLAVGGPLVPGEAEDYWKERSADWKAANTRIPSRDETLPVVASVPGRETLIELRGKEFSGTDAALPTRILAVIALGCGKGSVVFERWRETNAWSYRQEGFIWPTRGGFQPRFIMATGDATPAVDLANAMRKELVDAVAGWSDADLERARGMAEGILVRGLVLSPFYFAPAWPVQTTLDDETFLTAYWPMKTGEAWNPKKLLGQMALVSVADMKEAAADIVKDCEARITPAQK